MTYEPNLKFNVNNKKIKSIIIGDVEYELDNLNSIATSLQTKQEYIDNFYEYNKINENTSMLNVKATLEKVIGELWEIKNRLGIWNES